MARALETPLPPGPLAWPEPELQVELEEGEVESTTSDEAGEG